MATHTASSAAYADVLTAYNACSSGDTLEIPSGDATWTSTLNVTKALAAISGAGPTGGGRTRISYSGGVIFDIAPTTDTAIKISGISFDKVSYKTSPSTASNNSITFSSTLTNGFWIDNCEFVYGAGMVRSVTHRAYGVISNCTAYDCYVFYYGSQQVSGDDGAYEWTLGTRAGTDATVVIEDTDFIFTSGSDGKSPDSVIYLQEGGRATVRHCSFDSTASTVSITSFTNGHGYYSTWGRGTTLLEVYECAIDGNSSFTHVIGLRGGTQLCYNNTITRAGAGVASLARVRNESHTNSSGVQAFNATDQNSNCHFWGNTSDGTAQDSLSKLDAGAFNFDPDTNGVSYDKAEWSTLMTPSSWAASTSYVQASPGILPSYVKSSGNLYRCLTSHTSGSSFSDDLAAGKWIKDEWHIITRAPQSGDTLYPYTALEYPHWRRSVTPPPPPPEPPGEWPRMSHPSRAVRSGFLSSAGSF